VADFPPQPRASRSLFSPLLARMSSAREAGPGSPAAWKTGGQAVGVRNNYRSALLGVFLVFLAEGGAQKDDALRH
jgi:hypothetical protein